LTIFLMLYIAVTYPIANIFPSLLCYTLLFTESRFVQMNMKPPSLSRFH